jgi:hypothetical protein
LYYMIPSLHFQCLLTYFLPYFLPLP